MNRTLQSLIAWVITLAIPFFLLMTAIRILFTPLYPQVVYRTPNFPIDMYGFNLQDRLHWATISMNYLLNDANISFLAQQQLPDGSPLYNERELSHMLDVKILVQKMIVAWYILLAGLAASGIWAWRAHWMKLFLHALGRGGKWTIALVVLILAGVAISFNALFTGFHEIFFTGSSWIFFYSDSLIRLFPLPFWEYGFILMGIFTLAGAAFLIWLERRFAR